MRRTLLAFLLICGPAVIWFLFLRPTPTEVMVYFVRPAANEATLAPVARVVLATRSVESRLRGAYQALLAGPTPAEQAQGISTEIPAGTALRGLATGGGVVAVDLSGDLERGGGSSSMLGRVWQVVYTGTQFTGIARVRILIDGQMREAMGGEGLMIEAPFARPTAIPRF